MRTIKSLFTLLLVSVLLISFSFNSFAANGNVTYEKNAGDFIFSPGSDFSETDLFPDLKEVMPGDSLEQNITIKNNADWKVKVKIYLRSFGADEESKDFLSKLNLKVQKTDGTIMFDAPADQSADLTKWTYIGLLYSGGETDLKIILDVPTDLNNDYQQKIGHIKWQFKVEEYPVEKDDPKPPQTGDTSNIIPWVIGAAACFVLLIIVIILLNKKKKDDE